MASTPDGFRALTCSAPLARTQRMAAIAEATLPRDVRAVLDLGCGTGRLARMIAAARPGAQVLGLDLSAANIAFAQDDPEQLPNLAFKCADYLQSLDGPFDAIVTDGVLHLIAASNDVLLRKLAGDLRPGGRLVCCMPHRSVYNVAFSMVRTALRAMRTRPLDAAILAIGRALHGRHMSRQQLQERVHYMYLPPTRMMSPELERQMATLGLRVIGRHDMPSTSAAQLQHSVTIFEKA